MPWIVTFCHKCNHFAINPRDDSEGGISEKIKAAIEKLQAQNGVVELHFADGCAGFSLGKVEPFKHDCDSLHSRSSQVALQHVNKRPPTS